MLVNHLLDPPQIIMQKQSNLLHYSVIGSHSV